MVTYSKPTKDRQNNMKNIYYLLVSLIEVGLPFLVNTDSILVGIESHMLKYS